MKKADLMLNVERVCRLFGVPISSFYKQQESKTICVEKESMINKIKDIHVENIGCYGRRRMHKSLQNEGINIGIFKVARLMKRLALLLKYLKNHTITHLEMRCQISLIYSKDNLIQIR